jgi:hypothetical protein
MPDSTTQESQSETTNWARYSFYFLFRTGKRRPPPKSKWWQWWKLLKEVPVLVVQHDFYAYDTLVKKGTEFAEDERVASVHWAAFRYLDLALEEKDDVYHLVGFLPMKR